MFYRFTRYNTSFGTATITAQTADGNKTATCTVTVTKPKPTLTGTANPTDYSYVGGSGKITVGNYIVSDAPDFIC